MHGKGFIVRFVGCELPCINCSCVYNNILFLLVQFCHVCNIICLLNNALLHYCLVDCLQTAHIQPTYCWFIFYAQTTPAKSVSNKRSVDFSHSIPIRGYEICMLSIGKGEAGPSEDLQSAQCGCVTEFGAVAAQLGGQRCGPGHLHQHAHQPHPLPPHGCHRPGCR